MNQYRKRVKSSNRYREFVRVLNGALQLTEREIDVLSLLMRLDAEWPKGQAKYKDILSTDSRRIVMRETNINKSNLTKYAKDFKERGLVITDNYGNSSINSMFKPQETGKIIEILFTIDFGN